MDETVFTCPICGAFFTGEMRFKGGVPHYVESPHDAVDNAVVGVCNPCFIEGVYRVVCTLKEKDNNNDNR